MRNQLRCCSTVATTACAVYFCWVIYVGRGNGEVAAWLMASFLAVAVNQGIVVAFFKGLSQRVLAMVASFVITALATVSCIVGSLVFLYLDPIDYSDSRLLALILFLQVSTFHSILSSLEFVYKQQHHELLL